MIKKITMGLLIISLTACVTTQQNDDYTPVKSIFNKDFNYEITEINTLTDNKTLLKEIQGNKELMLLIKEGRNYNSINHSYYLQYNNLVDIVNAEKPMVEYPSKPIEVIKEDKVIKESIAIEDLATTTPSTTIKEPIIVKPVVTKPVIVKPVIVKPVIVKPKKTVNVKNKTTSDKKFKEEAHKVYLNVENDLKSYLYIIKAHCNEEDSYLLIDDIEDFKNGINKKVNNFKYENYIFKKYEDDINECLDIYNKNKMLNPDESDEDELF